MIDATIVGLGRWGQMLVGSVQSKSDRLRFTRAVVRNPEPCLSLAKTLGLVLTDDFEAVNLEAFADAVAGAAPYPIPGSQILATVAAFDAIAKAVKSAGRVAEV